MHTVMPSELRQGHFEEDLGIREMYRKNWFRVHWFFSNRSFLMIWLAPNFGWHSQLQGLGSIYNQSYTSEQLFESNKCQIVKLFNGHLFNVFSNANFHDPKSDIVTIVATWRQNMLDLLRFFQPHIATEAWHKCWSFEPIYLEKPIKWVSTYHP